MDELTVGDQIIRFDRERTRTVYSTVPSSDADRCGCSYCLNFAAQRPSVYSDEFLLLLDTIGIDPTKEGEVYEVGPEGDRRICGGWFYFAGEVAEEGERNSILTNFEFWFADAKRLPQPPTDFGDKVAAVEFLTRLPWVLADPPETP